MMKQATPNSAQTFAKISKGQQISQGEADHLRSKKIKVHASWIKKAKRLKEYLNKDEMQKVLSGLKKVREEYTGNIGGETDIANADNLMSEDIPDEQGSNVVAKTFDTKADFDSYVNQHRGIELTTKEQQAVIGFKNAKPTQQDRFFVKYEKTDAFGTNSTTVIKKLKEANQFCWTAFSKHEQASDEGKPEAAEEKPVTEQEESEDQLTVNDPIRITKSTTFNNDVEGSKILGDFLRTLDL